MARMWLANATPEQRDAYRDAERRRMAVADVALQCPQLDRSSPGFAARVARQMTIRRRVDADPTFRQGPAL